MQRGLIKTSIRYRPYCIVRTVLVLRNNALTNQKHNRQRPSHTMHPFALFIGQRKSRSAPADWSDQIKSVRSSLSAPCISRYALMGIKYLLTLSECYPESGFLIITLELCLYLAVTLILNRNFQKSVNVSSQSL